MVGKWMSSDRNTNGRFAAGWHGGPGRPRRTVEAAYLAALSEAVTPEVWRDIITTAIERAKGGDAKARDWLGSYLIGKPRMVVELAGPVGPRLTMEMLVSAIREAVPDGEVQARIAAAIARIGREAAGDGPSDERPGQPRLSPPVPAGHEHHHICGNVNSR
jgi:hypothetical protein